MRQEKSVTVKYLELFLEALQAERGCTYNTLSAYQKDIQDFFQFASQSPDTITPQHIEHYLTHLAQIGRSATTQARRLSALKQYFLFLCSENLLSMNPTQHVRSAKIPRLLPKTLSYPHIEKLLHTAQQDSSPRGIRLYTLLEMMYASGMRVTELISLPLSSIPQNLDDVHFLYIIGKGQKERVVPLGDMAIAALKQYLKIRPVFLENLEKSAQKWLFPSRARQGYLTRHRLYQQLQELAPRIGVRPEDMSPHVIRHAFATHLLQRGAHLLAIQKLLGHADLGTTQIYTHVAAQQVMDLVQQHHPLAKRKICDKKNTLSSHTT